MEVRKGAALSSSKGYKQTEVGLIPEDWEFEELRNYFSFISYGFTNPMPTVSDGVYMITANDINNGRIKLETARKTSEEAFKTLLSDKSRPRRNDILLTKDGTLGRLALVGNEKICINQSVAVIRPNEKIYPLFLKLLLEGTYYQKTMIDNAGGSTIKHIYITVVDKMNVAIPPTKSEQTAIATALSDADALITSLDKLIEKKQDIKQGAMQELLKPKEGWETKTLGEIGILKNGINKASEDFGFGYPFVNLLDVFGQTKISSNEHLGLINSTTTERKMYDLIKGDVLFIRSSVKPEGVGLTCVIDRDLENTVFSGFIIRFRDFGILSDEFKEYCFYSYEFRNKLIASSSVSANTNINQESLKKLSISYPTSKSEQTRIATILSDMDSGIMALEQKLAKYKQIKQGMMQELLTGRIRLIDVQ